MIKTGSWWTPLPPDHVRIGISHGTPRRLAPGYRLFTPLNPGPWFNSVDVDEYRRRYAAEILSRLDPAATAARLLELAGGRIPVLCCWERPGGRSWCHRALAAEWLAAAIGEPVPEIGFEDRTQGQHPLVPPPK